MIAKTFRDLNVYQRAQQVSRQIFVVSGKFPAEERYSLTDQVRRSSRAVKAMVAEAWGRRRYKAVFVNKLDEALEEATETQSWLDDALDANYISTEQFGSLDAECIGIGRMLSRMIDRADDFCKHAPSTDYRALGRVEERPLATADSTSLGEFFI